MNYNGEKRTEIFDSDAFFDLKTADVTCVSFLPIFEQKLRFVFHFCHFSNKRPDLSFIFAIFRTKGQTYVSFFPFFDQKNRLIFHFFRFSNKRSSLCFIFPVFRTKADFFLPNKKDCR